MVWKLINAGLRIRPPDGMYEVLEYACRLELLDLKGQQAVYTKRQKVRFLQDGII